LVTVLRLRPDTKIIGSAGTLIYIEGGMSLDTNSFMAPREP
jgi:hypothetical protein